MASDGVATERKQSVESYGHQNRAGEIEKNEGVRGIARFLEQRENGIEDAVENVVAREREEQASGPDGEGDAHLRFAPPACDSDSGKRESDDSDERVDGIRIRREAGDNQTQDVDRRQRIALMNDVRDRVAPAHRFVEIDPTLRNVSVLISGEGLKCADKEHDNCEYRRRNDEFAIDAAAADEEIEPNRGGCKRDEEWNLMVAAEPTDAKEEAAQRGTREGTDATAGAKQEQENQRNPNGSVQHIRPCDESDIAAEPECTAREQGRSEAAFQIAGKKVTEQCREVMDGEVIPIQRRITDVAVIERQGEQNPIQRVRQAGLHLADQRLAPEEKRVP